MATCSVVFDYSELRGKIKTKVGTEGEFAKLIGRTHAYVSKVFSGKSHFDTTDVAKAADVLDIPTSDIGTFFYAYKVHKSEQ